jgi:hypothetical protein
MDTQPKKSFLRKLWWLFIIIAIGVAFAGIMVFFGDRHDRDNEQKSGYFSNSPEDSVEYNKRVVKTFLPESGAAFKYASALLYNEHLYLGTGERTGYKDNAPVAEMSDNFFYKFDLDLNIVWEYPLKKRMVVGSAVMDKNHNLYFLIESVYENSEYDETSKYKEREYFSELELVSLTEKGELRWQKAIGGKEYWNRSMRAVTIGPDDTIYFGDKKFYAFNTEGDQIGQYPIDQKIIGGYAGAPIVDRNGNVYFVAPEPKNQNQDSNSSTVKAYKFTPQLTSLTWSTTIGNKDKTEANGENSGPSGGVESIPALGVGEKSLIALVGCTISKLDTESGQLLWATKPEGIVGYINASPAIDAEDNIYVGSKSNEYSKFFALKSDGSLLWSRFIGADLYTSPIVGDDNNVYAVSETLKDGLFHVMDRSTGEVQWRIITNDEKPVPIGSFSSFLLYKGYVYIGGATSKNDNDPSIKNPTLFKIQVDAQDYLPGAAWPRIHGSNDNSHR